ncbi:MAG: superoxide dismutase [Gammaproteobacteria bacterium]|nr:superoxide dismutase [Gammaproteobacteria bacterium]
MFKQVELNYELNALEPYIDALTVETHYGKHHKTYTANLNDLCEKAGVKEENIEVLLSHLEDVKEEFRNGIKNNGGGYYNHNLYFSTLSPNPKARPEGRLLDKINATFGSLEDLIAKLKALALGQFGSGWAWLSANKEGELRVSNSLNQDNPLNANDGFCPILALDVWEHAYYLKYKNVRKDYVDAFFNVLDWAKVEENYNRVTK